jgi:hypothetical protein
LGHSKIETTMIYLHLQQRNAPHFVRLWIFLLNEIEWAAKVFQEASAKGFNEYSKGWSTIALSYRQNGQRTACCDDQSAAKEQYQYHGSGTKTHKDDRTTFLSRYIVQNP